MTNSDFLTNAYTFLASLDWAFIIGLLASIATVASFWIQRRHNILSVRPIAEILVGDYENRLVAVIENKGTGPLIIKEFIVRNSAGIERKSVIGFFGVEFADVTWTMFLPDVDGQAILPGERKVLLELIGSPDSPDFFSQRDRVRRILSGLEAELHYQDIYKRSMPVKKRKFEFFSRRKVGGRKKKRFSITQSERQPAFAVTPANNFITAKCSANTAFCSV